MIDNRSMPASAVIPVLSYPDVEKASRWLCEAFGFELAPTPPTGLTSHGTGSPRCHGWLMTSIAFRLGAVAGVDQLCRRILVEDGLEGFQHVGLHHRQ